MFTASHQLLAQPAGGTWITAYQPTLNADVPNGLQTYTLRNLLQSTLFNPVVGTKVRITFEASIGFQWSVSSMYIGEQAPTGDPYDTVSMTEITFGGGNSGFAIGAGNTLLSDEITFSFDSSKSYVTSCKWDATPSASRGIATVTGAEVYRHPTSGVDEAATPNASTGYLTTTGANIMGLNKLEVFGS